MFYCMYLPDTKQETLNKAFAYILNRFPHLTDGIHKCPPERQQTHINSYTVHSLKWGNDCRWLGWGGTRASNELEIPFPSERLIIGEL